MLTIQRLHRETLAPFALMVAPGLRASLLAAQDDAMQIVLGMSLPPGMTITVLEEEPGQHYLVLPPVPPSLDALPLDDLELALVGGGRTLRPGFVNLLGVRRNVKQVSC